MKSFKNFREANVTNIDHQIDAQTKRYKAIKGNEPADEKNRERMRDRIERQRDRRNKLTGDPKREPVGEATVGFKKKPNDRKKDYIKHTDLALKHPDSAMRAHHARKATRVISRINQTEAKVTKGDFDLEDLNPTQYPSLDIDQAKKNAKKRKVSLESSNPMSKLNKFFDKNKAKADRSADLAKNPEKVKQVTNLKKEAKMKGEDPCWDSHEMVGTKKKNGKTVPNCVPKEEEVDIKEGLEDLAEVLNSAQRRKRGLITRRNKGKLKIARRRSLRRVADKDRLKGRAKKQAKTAIIKKLTKGVAKGDLSFARRAEIEKRLEKMKGRVDRISTRLLPSVRKQDQARRRGN